MKVTAKEALTLLKWFGNVEEESNYRTENFYYRKEGCTTWLGGSKTNVRGEPWKIKSYITYDEWDQDESMYSENEFLREYEEKGFEVDEYYVRNYILGLKEPNECV